MEKMAQREEARRRWHDHLRSWQASGLTQAEYCRKHNLNIKSFGYRKRTLRKTVPPALVEVPLPLPSGPITLCIGERYRIDVEQGFDAGTLKRLLDVL